MKLLKKHKEILQEVVKGKGYWRTATVPKNHSDGILDDLVKLYLQDLIVFNREYDVPSFGPSSEHKVRYKWYVVTINKKRTLNDLKKIIKAGKVEA
jgi:predicted DNA-binding ArsR family transcriptional regulator